MKTEITVKPLYSIDEMWSEARNMARRTVGKNELESDVSGKFKFDIIRSEHSPARLVWFKISFKNVPTFVAQQFSRHRIATERGDFHLHETVQATDVDHFVKTQRTDRTGNKRGPQNAPIDYDCVANIQGLIDMSKKRLCLCASVEAFEAWREVKAQIADIELLLASHMVPSCIYRGFCPETLAKCKYVKTDKYLHERVDYMNMKMI